jgi:hypothetical protein
VASRRPLLFVSCLLLMSLAAVEAQEKRLSDRARALSDALTELQKKPNDPVAQQRYLSAFPHDYKSFLQLFDLDQELCDGYDFISVLPSLAKNHRAEVGALLVGLSKDAHWEADAPNYLQNDTLTYAGQHTTTLVSIVDKLSSPDRVNFITFLADTEYHGAYKEYQELIDHLRALGQSRLAKEFEAARAKRKRQPHD